MWLSEATLWPGERRRCAGPKKCARIRESRAMTDLWLSPAIFLAGMALLAYRAWSEWKR
jgi:hypothetical protein